MEQNPYWPDKTVLVVEDDPITRIFFEKALRDVTQVVFAKNGLDAVEKVKSKPELDLILMDLKMPIKTGFEATTEIKNLRPGLPVIAESALAFPQDRRNAEDAGCDDFIPKPIDMQVLFDKMFKFLGKSEYKTLAN